MTKLTNCADWSGLQHTSRRVERWLTGSKKHTDDEACLNATYIHITNWIQTDLGLKPGLWNASTVSKNLKYVAWSVQVIIQPGTRKIHTRYLRKTIAMHPNLLLLTYSIAVCFTMCTLFFISSSSSRSHFSTWPRERDVAIVSTKVTSSPSLDLMVVTSQLSVKCKLAIPSKHLLRCGCTLKQQHIREMRISFDIFYCMWEYLMYITLQKLQVFLWY